MFKVSDKVEVKSLRQNHGGNSILMFRESDKDGVKNFNLR